MNILTHRGLEPGHENFFLESSLGAFGNHLSRGFGVEFDINFTLDNRIVIFHDSELSRITEGRDARSICKMNLSDVLSVELGESRICELNELLNLISVAGAEVNALHLKSKFQNEYYLDLLLECLNGNKKSVDSLVIFDVKISTARYLKEKMPKLKLAPSVAHDFDIARYNNSVGGTLISVSTAIKHYDLFDWVWLDEWDLQSHDGKGKNLYNDDIFASLRTAQFKIALVSPELHSTSPSLLGGEVHPDGLNVDLLNRRLLDIVKLNPDAICTDYPELLRSLIIK